LRRIWASRTGKVLVILGLALVVLAAASLAAAAYTERSSFCMTACHEMEPYGRTWQQSAHSDIACVRCHIKPGAVEFVEAKASALREVYVHVTGQVKAPIAVTEHIPNETCTASDCHPSGAVKDPVALGAVPFSHEQHAKVPLCIDCHSQVVHTGTPGRPYLDPTTMAYCLRCHDGEQASGDCETCHEAPHAARGKCTDCHTMASWQSDFTHPVKLSRPHRKLVCERCHTKSTATAMGFPSGCVSCHKKRHTIANVLCAKCHVTAHWAPSTFDHPKTGCTDCHKRPHPDRGSCLRCHTTRSWASHFAHPIALGGVHAAFPCERCHTNGLDAPGRGCSSCHGSQHGGLTDCQRCHSTSGWVPATFNHPAAGEHSAGSFACSACHPGGNFTSAYCSCHGGSPPSGD
jgi:c(7)-type cytochrome triheme protein